MIASVEKAMGAPSSSEEWKCVAKMTALFTAVAPLVAYAMVTSQLVVIGLFNSHYAEILTHWPSVLSSWLWVAYMVGAPYALLSGGAFAAIAILTGWHNVWVAEAVALAPLSLVHLLPAVGDPIWRWEPFFSTNAVCLVAVPTLVCWYLSRRWHLRSQ